MDNENLPHYNLCNNSSLPYPSYEKLEGNIRQTISTAELVMYHHQSMGSPPRTTFLRVIRKHPQVFTIFLGLKYDLIRKYLPLSTAALRAHMIH
jgi:hypothetical protein